MRKDQLVALVTIPLLFEACASSHQTTPPLTFPPVESTPSTESDPITRTIPGLPPAAAEVWNSFSLTPEFIYIGGNITMGDPPFTLENPHRIPLAVHLSRYQALAEILGCPDLTLLPGQVAPTKKPPINIYDDDPFYLNFNLFTACFKNHFLGGDWSDPNKIRDITPQARGEALARTAALARLPYENYLELAAKFAPDTTPPDELTYYQIPYILQQTEGLDGWPLDPPSAPPSPWEQLIPAPAAPQG